MVEHAFHAKTADKNTAKYAVYKRKKHFFTMFCKKSQNIHYYKVIMQVLRHHHVSSLHCHVERARPLVACY